MTNSSPSPLSEFLAPNSIAIVGASLEPTKRGYQALKALKRDGFQGKVFPIHPHETSILNLPTYKSVMDVVADIDLALICTPAKTLPDILLQCGQKKIKGVVILGAGFSEGGESGSKLELEVVSIAKKYNIRIIGPNTSGIFNLHKNMDLVGYSDLQPGGLGVLSQSGNMALTLITEGALNGHVGFSTYVGVGNQADINFSEYLEYFSRDPNTKVPILYVEGFKDGRRFLDVARKTTQKKPVVIYKAGRTNAGQKSASSHTGALAGSFDLTVGVLRQAGITVVRDADKILPVAETLSLSPPTKGERIAVLADGGGHATIATDALVEAGLTIAKLNASTRENLAAILPSAASLINPVDVAGGSDSKPGVLADCADILLGDTHVDAVLMVGLFGGYSIRFSPKLKEAELKASERIGTLVNKHNKPIIIQSLYTPMKTEPLERVRELGVPVYASVETAAQCLTALVEYSHSKTRNASSLPRTSNIQISSNNSIASAALADGRSSLYEFEALELLKVHGINIPAYTVIRSQSDIPAAAREFNKQSAAMKIVSKDILHKSDAGGVMLNVKGKADMRDNYNRIIANAQRFNPDAEIECVLIAPMASSGVEVIIGVIQDPVFGPVMMFGLGGVFVEILKDVVFRAIPLSKADVEEMLDEINSAKVLQGERGNPPIDRAGLIDLMMKLSTLVQAHPGISEIDLNPIIVRENGYSVVDARIILSALQNGALKKYLISNSS
jgi:acetate---CoA ligase (ADP-forming)